MATIIILVGAALIAGAALAVEFRIYFDRMGQIADDIQYHTKFRSQLSTPKDEQ